MKKSKKNPNISSDKLKWKHNIPTLMGYSKSNSKREDYMTNGYINRKERSQINNLNLQVKGLEKKE